MRMKSGLLFILLAVFALESNLFGQGIYSYFDESGVQVFTNIPPVNRALDLKVTGNIPAPRPSGDPKSKLQSYDSIISKYADRYQLDPALLRSIIATESGFNPKAVSSKGARGLMQLMPATAARLGVSNAFDPEQNIKGGAKHFRSLLDSFDNSLTLSLAAYNAGENLVQRLGRVPAIRETYDYVQSVTRRYGKKELSTQAQETARIPSMYRFVDEAGVLHLTNIPPNTGY